MTEHRTEEDRDRDKLSAWLAEWRIAEALADHDEMTQEHVATLRSERLEDVFPDGHSECRTGDIRLLHPCLTPLAVRPLYIAMLDGPAPGLATIVPFGPFTTPATHGELQLTARRAPPLRVLCVWNRTLLPMASLRQSWRVDSLSKAVQSNLRAVLRADELGRRPSPRLLERTGPRLCHPSDPRHTYLRRERALMNSVREEAAGMVDGGVLTFAPREGDGADAGPSWRMAAEGASSAYGHARRWAIGGTGFVLVASREGDAVEFSVETATGDRSRQMDEALIVTRLRHHTIRHGVCRVPRKTIADGFVLCDAAGLGYVLGET